MTSTSTTTALAAMTTGAKEEPYEWLSNNVPAPSPDVFQLWTEVANGLDTTRTVIWMSAVESLKNAFKFLQSSQAARLFVEKYMETIIEILLLQNPCKIGLFERDCIMDSVKKAVDIVALDLDIQIRRNGECRLLSSLAMVLDKTSTAYYRRISEESVRSFGANHGDPSKIPLKMLHHFSQSRGGGFGWLQKYLMQKIGQSSFPKSEHLHHILSAVADALLGQGATEEVEADAISIGNAVLHAINLMTDDQLNKFVPGLHLLGLMQDLRRLFDGLVTTRPDKTYEFYAFWRALVLRLINSEHFLLGKVVGWKMIKELIQASANHRAPPCSFMVKYAGCAFVNGQYNYAGPFTEEGKAKSQHGVDVSYVRKIPEEEEHGGEELTLLRYTTPSQEKWWFISVMDAEQPGMGNNVDYYQHNCRRLDNAQATLPPPRGWTFCQNNGRFPDPLLEASKECMPMDKVSPQTLEELLFTWAIDNSILEKLPCGNGVYATEVEEYSTALSKFLAHMYVMGGTADSTRNQDGTRSASSITDSNMVVAVDDDDDDMTE